MKAITPTALRKFCTQVSAEIASQIAPQKLRIAPRRLGGLCPGIEWHTIWLDGCSALSEVKVVAKLFAARIDKAAKVSYLPRKSCIPAGHSCESRHGGIAMRAMLFFDPTHGKYVVGLDMLVRRPVDGCQQRG